MKVILASEFRCNIFNGEYYLLPKAYYIYKRYADAFGKLTICSRFVEVRELTGGMLKVDFIDSIIRIESLADVLIGKYDSVIKKQVYISDLVICRFPSMIAYRVAKFAYRKRIPYIAELMCDGWDSYWNHGLSGKIIAPYMHYCMKKRTYLANYSLYVTEKYLQDRYPCKCLSVNASNVALKETDSIVLKNRINKIAKMDRRRIKILTTADVDVVSKGHRFVIEAIKKLKLLGYSIEYYLAGAGNRELLTDVANQYDVIDNIHFLGRLKPEEVINYLDYIDIYIHPSLQEGLPRAVIEAMSRACPCLGARTAGIPELLDEECIFKRKSSDAIVAAMTKMLNSDMSQYARNNFEKSKDYYSDVLDQRRNAFFDTIRQEIEKRST